MTEQIECVLCEYVTNALERRHGYEVTYPAASDDAEDLTGWVCPTCSDVHTVEEAGRRMRDKIVRQH